LFLVLWIFLRNKVRTAQIALKGAFLREAFRAQKQHVLAEMRQPGSGLNAW